MAVPKRKRSKMRMRSRKAANRFHAGVLVECSQCGSKKRMHTACPSCGYYRERQVVSVELPA